MIKHSYLKMKRQKNVFPSCWSYIDERIFTIQIILAASHAKLLMKTIIYSRRLFSLR